MSQSSNVGFAEGDASLLSDAVVLCIKPLLQSHNLIYSSFSPSLFSTALRRRGRSTAAIFF